MSGSIGGSYSHAKSTSSSMTGILSHQDKLLKGQLRSLFANRVGTMGVQGLALPGYDKPMVLPYSSAQNAGLQSLQGVVNPVDVAGVGTAARSALAYQFKNLITPDLLDTVGSGGGGRYSTAVADVAGKYLGSASLDLETELAKLDVNAQEAAKSRQMTLAQDQNAYLAILDPQQYNQQQQATAAYNDFTRQWADGGFFNTLWQSLYPTKSYSQSRATSGSGSGQASGGVGGGGGASMG